MFYIKSICRRDALTQVGIGSDDHLSFPLGCLFEVQRSHSFIFELRLFLIEHFTPGSRADKKLINYKSLIIK